MYAQWMRKISLEITEEDIKEYEKKKKEQKKSKGGLAYEQSR